MLAVEGLQAAYGHSQVLFDLSLAVRRGELVTLLGRNGMGKTTTIRAVMGLLPARGGSVRFEERPIMRLAPESVARLGVGLVPEGRQVFPTLTVRENLVATAANRGRAATPWTLPRIFALFPQLRERAGQIAGTLSGGEQQMLAIGRALMTNPKLLILDEATEGLAPVIRTDIWRCIGELKREGQAILIVDKNLAPLKRLGDRHFIIEKGRTVWAGTSAELDADPDVAHRYLGV
ncbi:MAG: ABC transporter ATP-binding protein [Acetobacteraceae bacterium]